MDNALCTVGREVQITKLSNLHSIALPHSSHKYEPIGSWQEYLYTKKEVTYVHIHMHIYDIHTCRYMYVHVYRRLIASGVARKCPIKCKVTLWQQTPRLMASLVFLGSREDSFGTFYAISVSTLSKKNCSKTASWCVWQMRTFSFNVCMYVSETTLITKNSAQYLLFIQPDKETPAHATNQCCQLLQTSLFLCYRFSSLLKATSNLQPLMEDQSIDITKWGHESEYKNTRNGLNLERVNHIKTGM